MASSTVWDITESAVVVLSRLPLILQTAAVLISAQAVIAGADKLVILKSSLSAMLGKGFWTGMNPFG